jgi:hypothetical protein
LEEIGEMYLEGEFETDDGDWVIGDPRSFCPSESPDRRWVCTRAKGHKGVHVGGTGYRTYGAYWSTISEFKEKDFFADIGL